MTASIKLNNLFFFAFLAFFSTTIVLAQADFATNEDVRIENYWKKGQRINVETNLTSSVIKDGAWSAMWIFKPVAGTNFYRIENKWKTGERLHIENGTLESSQMKDGAWSAMWEIKRAPASNKSFWIVNRWKPEQKIHVEYGKLECSKIHDGANSAFWYILPVSRLLPNAEEEKTLEQEIVDGLNDTGDEIINAAEEVGKGVEKAAEETGDFIKSIFDF